MDGLINNIFGGECITIFYITKESFNIVQGEVEGNVTFFEVMNFRLVKLRVSTCFIKLQDCHVKNLYSQLTHRELTLNMNSMKLVIPLHFIVLVNSHRR